MRYYVLPSEPWESVKHSRIRDAQLIEQIDTRQSGRQAAINTLITRYQQWIFRRCLTLLQNHFDAQDVTQEVLIRMYRGLSGFEGRASFISWLRRIVDNQCRSYAVRRTARTMTAHFKAAIVIYEQSQRSQDKRFAQENKPIDLVLARLPRQAREILLLRFYHDLSLEEIAQILDIGLSAAKMRLYRALKQFKYHYQTMECGARCTAAA